jgi:hypothetical protein
MEKPPLNGLNPKSWTKLEISYNDEPGILSGSSRLN